MSEGNYLYVLHTATGQHKLNTAPEGWSELGRSFSRDEVFMGVFTQYVVSLSFVGDGKVLIDEEIASAGPDGSAAIENEKLEGTYIGIYKWHELPVGQFIRDFVGKLDLSTKDITEYKTTLSVLDTGFAEKIRNRKGLKVNIGSTESVEGIAILPAQTETMNMHQRKILLPANLILDEVNKVRDANELGADWFFGHSLPVNVVLSDIDNITDPFNWHIYKQGSFFFTKATNESTVNFSGRVKGSYVRNVINFDDFFTIRKFTDADGDLSDPGNYTDNVLLTIDKNIPSGTFDFTFNINVNIEIDNAVSFILDSGSPSLFGVPYVFTYEIATLNVKSVDNFNDTTASCHREFEVCRNIIEHIADQTGVLESKLYARKEDGYEEDGAESLKYNLTGKQIRGFDTTPSISLKDKFASNFSMDNIGLGIEKRGLREVVVIEPMSYFFDGNVVAAIHNISELDSKFNRDWYYNSVIAGYEKAEYEEVNGLEEFNNKYEWATRLKSIVNELNLVSKIRGDGNGIEFARRKQKADFPTEDTKYDTSIFMVDAILNGTTLQARKNEGFDLVENIFSPETAYNLRKTPGRMLRNHGEKIVGSLKGKEWDYLSDKVKFLFAENNSDLRSREIGEDAITENEHIDPKTLKDSFWTGNIHSFKAVIDSDLSRLIESNPRGIYKYSTTTRENTRHYHKGWILDINAPDESGDSTCRMLEVNEFSSSFIITDPTGISDKAPGSDPFVPPAFAFVFGFPIVFTG